MFDSIRLKKLFHYTYKYELTLKEFSELFSIGLVADARYGGLIRGFIII